MLYIHVTNVIVECKLFLARDNHSSYINGLLCFRIGGSPSVCVDALLEASVKYSPHFDWVVAHIGYKGYCVLNLIKFSLECVYIELYSIPETMISDGLRLQLLLPEDYNHESADVRARGLLPARQQSGGNADDVGGEDSKNGVCCGNSGTPRWPSRTRHQRGVAEVISGRSSALFVFSI